MFIGVFLALLTSVSWALGNIYVQKSGRVLGAPRAMLWALASGAILALIFSRLLGERLGPITPQVIGWLAAAGASGLLAYVCLFIAFARAPLSIAVPLVSSWSLFSGVLSLTVLEERLRPMQLAGAAMVFAGVVLVSVGSVRGRAAHEEGAASTAQRGSVWAGLGSALGFGIMVPALTRVAPVFGEFGASAAVYACGIILGLPFAAVLRVNLRPPPRTFWSLVLITGCFETFGFVAVAFARRFAPMAVVTPVASLAAALTVLYAWVVLRERPDRSATIGAALACVGIVILSL